MRSGHGIHCDIVNPRWLELEVAKEILAELYGIQISEVEDLIQQYIVDFQLMGVEFRLKVASRAVFHSDCYSTSLCPY